MLTANQEIQFNFIKLKAKEASIPSRLKGKNKCEDGLIFNFNN